jgi:hypothetical protein
MEKRFLQVWRDFAVARPKLALVAEACGVLFVACLVVAPTWFSGQIGGTLFESLLTLVYTAPAVGLAFYGLTRNQSQKAAQVTDGLEDRTSRLFIGFSATATTALLVAVAQGLQFVSVRTSVAPSDSVRTAALVMVASVTVGVYAIVRALVIYRAGLQPESLAGRLRDDFVRAAVSGNADAAKQRAEDLRNLALLSAEEGRVANFEVFINQLGALRPPDGVQANAADDMRKVLDDLLLVVAERVVDRGDLFALVVKAVLKREEKSKTIADRIPNLFVNTLSSEAALGGVVVELIDSLKEVADEGFWRRILLEAILRGVDRSIWTAIRDGAANDWGACSARMRDEDLTTAVSDVLAAGSAGPISEAVSRLVDLLVAMNAKRPITPRVAKVLASGFKYIADAVPAESALDVFAMLLSDRADAGWALRRFDLELEPEVRLLCNLQLALGRPRRSTSADGVRHVLTDQELPLQLRACKTILRRAGDHRRTILLQLFQLFRAHSLGYVPVIARLLDDAARQDADYGTAGREAAVELGGVLELKPGFSRLTERPWASDGTNADPGELRSERKHRADQILAAVEAIVDRYEEELESVDKNARVIPDDVARGWDECLLLLLEVYADHDLDARFAALVGRMVEAVGSFEKLQAWLTADARRYLSAHADGLVWRVLPQDANSMPIHTTFSTALETGTAGLIVGALTRVPRASSTSQERARFAEAIVLGVDQPQVRVTSCPLLLAEVLGRELAVALGKRHSAGSGVAREGMREFVNRLLESMVPPDMNRVPDDKDVKVWVSLLISYFATNPPSEGGKTRTLDAFVNALLFLNAIDARPDESGPPVDGEELRHALRSWLSKGRESIAATRVLGRAPNNLGERAILRDLSVQDRHRVGLRMARELIDCGIGVVPVQSDAGGGRGSDDDLLLLVSRWIDPPRGVRPSPEEAHLAAEASIAFTSGVLELGHSDSKAAKAYLVALVRHFSRPVTRQRPLFDQLENRMKRRLLLAVMRFLLSAFAAGVLRRPSAMQMTAMRAAFRALQELSEDAIVLEPIWRGLDALDPQPVAQS